MRCGPFLFERYWIYILQLYNIYAAAGRPVSRSENRSTRSWLMQPWIWHGSRLNIIMCNDGFALGALRDDDGGLGHSNVDNRKQFWGWITLAESTSYQVCNLESTFKPIWCNVRRSIGHKSSPVDGGYRGWWGERPCCFPCFHCSPSWAMIEFRVNVEVWISDGNLEPHRWVEPQPC